MKLKLKTEPGVAGSRQPEQGNRLISTLAWVVAFVFVALAIYLGWRTLSVRASGLEQVSTSKNESIPQPETGDSKNQTTLPTASGVSSTEAVGLSRQLDLHTTIPERPELIVRQYTVTLGDSVFGIAAQFSLKPESVLWANYDQLNDNPDMISLDMTLNIPPTNGVLYQWQQGDTIESVAAQFEALPQDILNWSGNNLDLTNPVIEPGALVMVPGGKREYRQWLIPTIARGSAGVSAGVYGGGACPGNYEGAYGTGSFIWPAGNHVLSGNDYWDGHLAIDIGAGEGATIYAADSGVVVFAGWATGGYGNMVMIDHGNGYQTLYAHMSSVKAYCGQSVGQGTTIGYSGSTGNSTGAHLHFEVRYLGGFINPWYILPAP